MEGYGSRVLVVDDEDDVRELMADALVRAGYSVFTARDGMEALGEIKKRRFEVIVTDYQMPMMNGLELLSLSRVLVPNTPVIMVSGAASAMEQVALERGAFAWIRKPSDPRTVLEMVRIATRPDQSTVERAAAV